MPLPMDWLLIATGFTGALTFRWLLGLVLSRSGAQVETHFLSTGEASDLIAKQIAQARTEVLLRASEFSAQSVAQALVDAGLRGVKVEILLDHGNETDPSSRMHFLVEQGLPPLLDEQHSPGRSYVVIDGTTVLTGSFTLVEPSGTDASEQLLILHGDSSVSQKFREEFEKHKAHARVIPAKPARSHEPQPEPDQQQTVADSWAGKPARSPEPQLESAPMVEIPVTSIPVQTEESEPLDEAPLAPVMTQATSDLLARLRQELGTQPASTESLESSVGKKKRAG